MLDIDYLNDGVITAILNNKELPELPESYKVIEEMSPRDAFDAYLTWHGFIGFTDQILSAWESIQTAESAFIISQNEPSHL